jgi:hypothetical protein
MAVAFQPGTPPRLGNPRRLFEFSNRDLVLHCWPTRCYDVAPDGQQFYGVQYASAVPAPSPVTHVRLVQHWFEELSAKVPAPTRPFLEGGAP